MLHGDTISLEKCFVKQETDRKRSTITPNVVDFTAVSQQPSSGSNMPPKVLFNNHVSPLGTNTTIPGGSPSSAPRSLQGIRPSINTDRHTIDKLIAVGLKYINGCPECYKVKIHRSTFTAADYMAPSGGGHVVFLVSCKLRKL